MDGKFKDLGKCVDEKLKILSIVTLGACKANKSLRNPKNNTKI